MDAVRHRSRNAAACSPSPAGSGRGARVKSAKLGSPPRDFPRSWTCSSRELTVRGSVDSPVGEIPWFLCASAEELHARGPLPVKEIAIYYDRWEGEGEGSLCLCEEIKPREKTQKISREEKRKRANHRRELDLSLTRLEARLFFHRLWAHFI